MIAVVCSACDSQAPCDVYQTHCPDDGAMLTFAGECNIYPMFLDRHGPFGARLRGLFSERLCHVCRERESLLTSTVDARDLGQLHGIPRLLLKVETGLPTGTTKARMAAVALPYLLDKGVEEFVVVSTGNSHSAMARLMARYPEMKMIAYIGRSFLERCRFAESDNVKLMVVDGDFVAVERAAKAYAVDVGATWEGGFFNPARRLGLATAYLEVCVEIDRPVDWYVQGVSSGMGLVGTAELAACLQNGAAGVGQLPRLLAVQQDTCAPMVHAFNEGATEVERRHVIENPSGIAQAILRGDPSRSYPHVRKWVLRSRGGMIAVTQSSILDALREVRDRYGIRLTPDGAAAVAGALRWGRQGGYADDDIVLVNVSG